MNPPSRYLDGVAPAKRRRAALAVALALIVASVGTLTVLRAAAPPPVSDDYVPAASSPRPAITAMVAGVLVFAVALATARAKRSQLAVLGPMQRARLALAQGDLDEAQTVLRAALAGRTQARARAQLLDVMALVALERGDFDDALAVVTEAEAGLKRGEVNVAPAHDTLRADLRILSAEALLGLGRLDEAARRLDPLPDAWLPNHRAAALALSICVACRRGDRDGALRLLRDNATAIERTLPMRSRWLMRAVELYASTGSVPANALPDDPALSRWIARRFPHAPEVGALTSGGAS